MGSSAISLVISAHASFYLGLDCQAVVNTTLRDEADILALRHKEGLSWDKIAMELDVGRRIVYEMHSAILTVLAYEFGLL